MKRVISGLLNRLRRAPPAKPRGGGLDRPHEFAVDATGSTVYGDVALRYRGPPFDTVDPPVETPSARSSAFKIRLARSRLLSQDAKVLVERRYAWRGYEVRGMAEDPNLRTFIAYRDGQIAGTLSVRVDSGKGLSADKLYKTEIDRLRATGDRVSEFTRLAVDDLAVSNRVLGTLIHTAFMYLHDVCRCKYAVFEVNPRHAAYYERGLFCDRIGPQRMNDRVGAPAVLLCMTLERTASEAEKFFANPARLRSARSPLSHWFPPDEARGVLARLQALDHP
jgi:hypothetical protein